VTQVQVNGSHETWKIEWKLIPKPYCPPAEDSLTCPCSGFAYGERGKLDLVRTHAGREIERLDLGQFFGTADLAILQKWSMLNDGVEDFIYHPEFANRVRQRPVVRVIQLKDYNHDRMPTKFFLQTDVASCGKILGVVVGVSARNLHLHALGTVHNPDKPLVPQKREWDALLASDGEVNVIDWTCLDHGSPEQTELTLRAPNGLIAVERRRYACNEDGVRGKLLQTDEQ
jgi:hypothetical protein